VKRIALVIGVVSALLALPAQRAAAADEWTETRSTHFTIWSNAGDGQTRDLLWQLEQIRFAVKTLWPWTLELTKPMLVLGVKDEESMRMLAPRYWEQKGGVRPVSVWVTGLDQHYMVIRADLRTEDNAVSNPYRSAYFAYVNLILSSSFGRELPLWFSRGLAGVQSNTIVRGNQILLGPPIASHLERLQSDARLKLKELITVTRSSREYTQEQGQIRFDAQAWALVHFLMFGQNAARRKSISTFASLLDKGTDPEAAFVEAFGAVEKLEPDFAAYINRSIYSFQQFDIDKATKREQFTTRKIFPAQAAAGLASFHVAMGRSAEARTLIDKARKEEPNSPDAYAAEAQLLLRDSKSAEAAAAFMKAADLGSTNARVYYRAARSMWSSPRTEETTLQKMDKYLVRATELDATYPEAFAELGDVRSALKQSPDDVIPLLGKAVKLDPFDPWIRLTVARAFWRLGKYEEARNVARVALALSGDDDRAKADAERLLATIPEKR
jgi:tetratricopeptide (TPR) repeat protein